MLEFEKSITEEKTRKYKKEGLEKGKKIGMQYNIPINVDTIKEGYPILCA